MCSFTLWNGEISLEHSRSRRKWFIMYVWRIILLSCFCFFFSRSATTSVKNWQSTRKCIMFLRYMVLLYVFKQLSYSIVITRQVIKIHILLVKMSSSIYRQNERVYCSSNWATSTRIGFQINSSNNKGLTQNTLLFQSTFIKNTPMTSKNRISVQ